MFQNIYCDNTLCEHSDALQLTEIFEMSLSNNIYWFQSLKNHKILNLRPQFSTNLTFENPLKNPTSYLVKAGFKDDAAVN